jgi:hypothetical protein
MPIGLTRLQPGMDSNTMIAAINENFAALEALNRHYIVKDSTGTARVLLGQGGNNFNGLKVSKPGTDVEKATNDQLIFNSDQSVFKIVSTDTATVPAIATPGNFSHVTVTHTLGYVPIVMAYALFSPTNVQPLPSIGVDITTGTVPVLYDVENVTATTFQLWATFASTGVGSLPAVPVKYYLLQESAS